MQAPAAADALIERSFAHVLADGQEAARIAREALRAAEGQAPTQALAHGLLALVEMREGDTGPGLQHLQAGRQLLEAGDEASRAARLLQHVQGQWLRREGQLAQAQDQLVALHAVAENRPAVDAYLTAAAVGVVMSMRGDAEGALDLMYQALHLARRSGVESLVVNALSNLGSYETEQYNLEDARPMLEEALAGALRLDSRRQIVFAAGNLVQCLCLMGEAPRALAVAREHLQARIGASDPPALWRDEEIAQALLANGLVDEAAAQLARAPAVGTMTNEVATARVCLDARILLARQRPGDALALCLARQAVLAQGGEEVTTAIDHVDLLRVGAQAAAVLGDTARAYGLLDQAFRLYEALLGRAARWRRLSLQISHRLHQAQWDRDSARQLAASLEDLNASLRAEASENARLQQRLLALAMEDPLTGLHNRRYLFETGTTMLAMASRRAEPLTASVLDLDFFKRINDRHGHDTGDQVLRGFAELLRSQTRVGDLLCRHGGEEFVLLFPGADGAQAGARLEVLLARFSAVRFAGSEGEFGCTFSAGVATWRGEPESLEQLLQRADAALYDAKQGGRNRVRRAAD